MIVNRLWFYKNSPQWRKARKAKVQEKLQCERCGSFRYLQVHHVEPIKWVNDEIEVDSVDELCNVDLEVLCASCHGKMDDKNSVLDIGAMYANKK